MGGVRAGGGRVAGGLAGRWWWWDVGVRRGRLSCFAALYVYMVYQYDAGTSSVTLTALLTTNTWCLAVHYEHALQ